jgi:hypothetical protein
MSMLFGLLSRKTRKARPDPTAGRRARLGLEALESRWIPSVVTLTVSYGVVKFVTLSGSLRGDQPGDANQGITITGMANGTATTDANGFFSVTLLADGLGDVHAAATDGSSNIATVTLTDPAPVMNYISAIERPNDEFELKGTLKYSRPFDSMPVTITGQPVTLANGITTNANSDGNFDIWVTLNGTATDNGEIWATATDAWGQVSNTVYDSIHQTGT